ncbi:Bcr/CflA family drug resistance efflux transporter, partial [Pseudomonas otitidis]|nr:Bcr/CflA family drug resistance efflux transporter [Pseudomonas otitidis]
HLVTMFATLVAPLLGGYLMLVAGWRSLFVVLMVFAGLLGVLNAVDTPLRQSLLSRFVDEREDLANALALNA